jgi:hypothetical protein
MDGLAFMRADCREYASDAYWADSNGRRTTLKEEVAMSI